jgi:hypothetical protein
MDTPINYKNVSDNYNWYQKRLNSLWSYNEMESQTYEKYEHYLYNIKYFYSPWIDYYTTKRDILELAYYMIDKPYNTSQM